MEAEDPDAWEDLDGCPEPDNDSDGIPDVDDKCMLDAEDLDGDEDTDGCPEESNPFVKVTEEQIEITQQINFANNSDRITGTVSFEVLDAIIAVLNSHPTMVIRVEGHTDNRGRDEANLRLSQQRADSVRRYLLNGGIAPDRLTAEGFGEIRPIEDNATQAGRAANRRVEFHIVHK